MAFSRLSTLLDGRSSDRDPSGGDGHRYDPNQPRVPAGHPDGGQWTSGGGSSGDRAATHPNDAVRLAMARRPASDGSTFEFAHPEYDAVDSARLAPAGVDSKASRQELEYSFGEGGYMGSLTLENVDRSWFSTMSRMTGRDAFVDLELDATIETADETVKHKVTIKRNLETGEIAVVPLRSLPMQGPGRVTIKVTNKGPYFTAVTVGARKSTDARIGR